MAKIKINSSKISRLWKELTGTEIEDGIFTETTYKVLVPLALLYDVRKDFIQMLSD